MKGSEQRFWPKVDKRGPDDCWLWTGSLSRPGGKGYGAIRTAASAGSRSVLAHRYSYELHNGPIPKGDGFHGICVLHKCDVRACVNPAHLFLGTQADVLASRFGITRTQISKIQRGEAWSSIPHTSQPRANLIGNAKLSEADVLAIRASSATGRALARQYGVVNTCIYNVRNRKSWQHVRSETP